MSKRVLIIHIAVEADWVADCEGRYLPLYKLGKDLIQPQFRRDVIDVEAEPAPVVQMPEPVL